MDFTKTEFIKSAASPSAFLNDGRPQIVFAGRSNVGKSSVINRLTQRKNFARVGNTPGKTAHVNYFLVDGEAYIADLPGYGYAEVSASEKRRWAELMESYFASGLVTAGVLIVDARHKPTADDVKMAEWFRASERPMIALCNKLDKLKKSEIEPNIARCRETLGVEEAIAFSAETGLGRAELAGAVEKLAKAGRG